MELKYFLSNRASDFLIILSLSFNVILIIVIIFARLKKKHGNLAATQDQISKSKQFLRKVIDACPNLIFIKDREGRFKLVNQAVADIYGTTVEDLIGKADKDFNCNNTEVQHFIDYDRVVIDYKQEVFITEEKITDSRGHTHWLQTTKRPIEDDHEGETLVLGIATDISENKKLYEQLAIPYQDITNPQNMEEIISSNSPLSGHGKILIIDDHQILLDVTSKMLSFLGYDVVTANDGKQAVRYYADNYKQIDLIILDSIMPNMRAEECFNELLKINSSVKVILSTGYGRNYAAEDLLNKGITAFIQKPFNIEKLSRIVAKAINNTEKSFFKNSKYSSAVDQIQNLSKV